VKKFSRPAMGAAAWEAPLDPPLSLKTAGSQLKRLTSTGHHMEIVKQVAIASLKVFGIMDDCMRVLVPIVHNAHHHNEPDICSGILFFNDECIANMHHMILIGRR
jgi:hypothetical protein